MQWESGDGPGPQRVGGLTWLEGVALGVAVDDEHLVQVAVERRQVLAMQPA